MEHEDTAYDSLAGAGDDHRWAFGTGFEDPLAGVDTVVAPGIDGGDLAAYCLMLGDDALVLSHRLQEWITRLPELEEEAAVANVALDLLGQARMLLARAGRADGTDRDEDALAFLREQHEFRNVRLVEDPDADFAGLVIRLCIFATWRRAVFERLQLSEDHVLAAIAAKAVKELTYHRDFAAQWVVRLGDGTNHSHERAQAALTILWPLVDELFVGSALERRLGNVAVDPAVVRLEFDKVMQQILDAATLLRPEVPPTVRIAGRTGRDGLHTEALGQLLAEMQSVARAHPGALW